MSESCTPCFRHGAEWSPQCVRSSTSSRRLSASSRASRYVYLYSFRELLTLRGSGFASVIATRRTKHVARMLLIDVIRVLDRALFPPALVSISQQWMVQRPARAP